MSMDSVTGAQFLSSLSVCSSPRKADVETMSNRSEDDYAGGSRVKLMCSYGGRIMPRPHDAQLRYVGGETRILVVNRNISFADFNAKLSKLCGGRRVFAKYKLPYEDLDALVSIISDEDMESMVEEYDRLDAREAPSRLRVFLFPIDDFIGGAAAATVATGAMSSPPRQPLDPKLSRFVDALNYGPPPPPPPSAVPPQQQVVMSPPDFLCGYDQPAPVESIHGSTSSSSASDEHLELAASVVPVPPPPPSAASVVFPCRPPMVQILPPAGEEAQFQIQAPPYLPPIRTPTSAQAASFQAPAPAPSSISAQSHQAQASSSPQQQQQSLPPRGPKPSSKPGGDKKDRVKADKGSSPSSPSAVDTAVEHKACKNATKDKDLPTAADSVRVPSPGGHLVEEKQSPPPPLPQQQTVDFAAELVEKLRLMNAGDSEDEQGINSRANTGTGTFSPPTREMSLNVFMEQQHKEDARSLPLHDKMLKFSAVDNDKLVLPPSPPVPPPTEPPVQPPVPITEPPVQPPQPSYQYVTLAPGAYQQGLTQHQPYYVDGNMIYLLPSDAFTQQQQRPMVVSSDMQRARTAGTPSYQRQGSSGSGSGSVGYPDQQPVVLPQAAGAPGSAGARLVYYPVPVMPRGGIHQAPPSRFRGECVPLAALNTTPQQIQLQHQQLVEAMPVRLPTDRI